MRERQPPANDNLPIPETVEIERGFADVLSIKQQLDTVLIRVAPVSEGEQGDFADILAHNKKQAPDDLAMKAALLSSQPNSLVGNRPLQLVLLALQKHFKDLLSDQ